MNEVIMKTEYSKAFDEKRKGLIEQSYYKYGPAHLNFATGNVDAIGSLKNALPNSKKLGILNICAMLQIMQCSGSCFHRKEISFSIPVLTNQRE